MGFARVAGRASVGLFPLAGMLACSDPSPSATTGGTDESTSTSTSGTTAEAEAEGEAESAPEPPGRNPVHDESGEPPDPDPRPDLGAVLPPPSPTPPQQYFVDVTAAAGLDLDPGDFMIPPFCMLQGIHDPPHQFNYCLPERFLGAAAVGDYDGDGWPDVYLTRMNGPGRLMRNRGDGSFDDQAQSAGLDLEESVGAAAWLDIEGDGDLDLMLTSVGGLRHHLYVNDGRGQFSEQARERGAAVETNDVHVGMSIAVGDYDLDGYVDMFVSDWRNPYMLGPGEQHNRLLHNLGAEAPGYFEDVSAAMGIDVEAVTQAVAETAGAYGFAPAFVDLDDDGWPELVLTNDFGTSRLYWNDGLGGFHDGTELAGVGTDDNGMGSTFGDIDGDGDLDWFVTSIFMNGWNHDGNRMYRNEGDRSFTDVTDAVGVREAGWGWGTAFFDVDLDGDLDLAAAAGWPAGPFSADPARLWINPGLEGQAWPDEAVARGLDFDRQGRGLVPFDFDRDGDLDLLVLANTERPGLYRNDVESGDWLEVRAREAGGNSQGVGVRVRVQAKPGAPWQVRIIGVGTHLFGQAEATAHFGLPPGEEPLGTVELTWPASGHTVTLTDVARNQRLEVSE